MARRQFGAKGFTAGIDKQWEVIFHDEFFEEFGACPKWFRMRLLSSLGKLREIGPSLGRPQRGHSKGSEYPNMKELRVRC